MGAVGVGARCAPPRRTPSSSPAWPAVAVRAGADGHVNRHQVERHRDAADSIVVDRGIERAGERLGVFRRLGRGTERLLGLIDQRQ